MTQTATEPNKVQVVDAGPSLKKLTIEVPAHVVTEKIRGQLDMLAGRVALPGFRAGRVPRQLVEKKFGPGVRKDAKGELAGQALQQAVQDLKLKVVGDAHAGNLDKVEVEEGKPFAFEVQVEVLPEFDLPSLEGIEVRKPMLEVTDAVVDEEVRKMCINEGSLESRDSAEAGDYCTGHAVMKGPDGTEFYNLEGAVIQVPTEEKNGRGMILGIMVDDFSKQIGTPTPGATLTIKAKGPENHEVEGIRGADLTMTFQVKRIDRIIPATVETIYKNYGMENEQQLRDAIKQRLALNVQIQQQSAMHQQVAKHLLEKTSFDLPRRLTAQQASRNLERRRLELMYRGVELHKIEEHMAELRQASSASAARDLKLFFILMRAAETLNIEVTQQEVNGRIAQLAFQRNVRPEQMRQELARTNQIRSIVNQVAEHKTLDAIVAKAKITEVPAEEFNKGAKAGAAAE
ncbi:MAG TPA: trigger factor [Phycisphaerales bacterium]|nr:trigger factor [Phycisphaerales bacterium]